MTIPKKSNLNYLTHFVVPLLRLHNRLTTTNFQVLKYIKKIFKVLTQCIFNVPQRTTQKKNE